MRSRLGVGIREKVKPRITSACAEQTQPGSGNSGFDGDHLRVCGADGFFEDTKIRKAGSPPRVRSRQLYFTVF